MNVEEVLSREDFKRCLEFHGHLCPGVSIGYRAARAAMEHLAARRAEDEEVVAVVETDACSADAVQVLTGCTFGKGNLIYRDHGKMVLTLLSRKTGEGVRVAMRPDAFAPDPEHMALIQKVTRGEANEAEKARFDQRHIQRSHDVLVMETEALFKIEPTRIDLPPQAQIAPSELCAVCGEPTMATKMEVVEGRKLCRDCFQKVTSSK
ncbi:MAG: FmdE family protein [Desulfobacteraceae bacterium]|jgi:formylmethanofuran dehydrogenase subunit E|nr:FmdE family protein [Desulfobacteraceae bacterium]MDD3993481.1 FmdE family protein [Desulfobacteraceae bacterium]